MPAVFKISSFQLPRGQYRDAEIVAGRITTPEVRNIMFQIIKAHHGGDADAAETGKLQEAMTALWMLRRNLGQPPVQARWNQPLNNLWIKMPSILAIEWGYLATRFPDDASVRYNAGLWMLDALRYQDAVTYLRSATKSQSLPISVRGIAFEGYGLALLYSGQVAEAEAPLLAALKQTPAELRAYCSLSEVYKLSGRSEDAARARANCPSGADAIPLYP